MGEIPESKVAKFTPEPSSWLSLRLFYLRVRKCEVKDSMLDSLTITHIPLTPDTVLQVNGSIQSSINNGHVSCSLRRDRVDRKSEEATFVSTETVRMTGSVRFEVQNKDEKLLVGILEMCDVDGSNGEAIKKGRSWVMKCQVAMQRGSGFLKGGEVKSPTIEVYVAGLSQGAPIVFTKAMHLHFRRKRQVKVLMEPIPECGEQVEDMKEMPQKHDPEVLIFRCPNLYVTILPCGMKSENSVFRSILTPFGSESSSLISVTKIPELHLACRTRSTGATSQNRASMISTTTAST